MPPTQAVLVHPIVNLPLRGKQGAHLHVSLFERRQENKGQADPMLALCQCISYMHSNVARCAGVDPISLVN
jgi:hypothetical protein